MALRDAMTAKEFDKKYANKPISFTNPPLATSIGAPNLLLPGDKVFFKNIQDYIGTRGKQTERQKGEKRPKVSRAYQGEQTVYVGGGQFCGFPLSDTFDEVELRKTLYKNYIAGHKDFEKWNGDIPFIKWLIDNVPIDLSKQMPISSQSQINRNAAR
jgi:hypothetical protein